MGLPYSSDGPCVLFCSDLVAMAPLTVCIVTVSDRCSRGEAEDSSGNNLGCEIDYGNRNGDERAKISSATASFR